ncbi:MAG: N-6 DNA methylase [Nitrospirota bacterium]
MRAPLQKLPPSGPEREALREKGQFWTPDWVAEAMTAYALAAGSDSLFDPAVGAGAFFLAAKMIGKKTGRRIKLVGAELDETALLQARQRGLSARDLSHISLTDFVLNPPRGPYSAIVANPPYIRHHRLPQSLKGRLRSFGGRVIGRPLDGRAGVHIYFLLRALQLLAPAGRLAFIMPADTCEGVFATRLWSWITARYRLDGVVTFSPEASPFPGVDTNPLIFLIRNSRPVKTVAWARCLKQGTRDLKSWMSSDLRKRCFKGIEITQRPLSEALSTGLSRAPQRVPASSFILSDFAKVLRGIATGANEYFFLTSKMAAELGIPNEFLKPAVGRTREVQGDEITDETLALLDAKGRPTLLFSPNGRPIQDFPPSVREYLKRGGQLNLPNRPLIASRRPWYKMEVRQVPPILFAYLGRRNARFIRNRAGVMPLTGFLCVYPRESSESFVDRLWEVLSHPETVQNLGLVGKSYGSGAIKVEPRALERLPLPANLVARVGLEPTRKTEQLELQMA